MNQHQRLQRLNFFAMTLVTLYTLFAVKVLATRTFISPLVDPIAVFLTSIGVYQILIEVLYFLIGRNKLALKLYWGREFLDGLWYYTYYREDKKGDPTKLYFGVWRFEQDLFRTRVLGQGLTEEFRVRSRVRSISDLVETHGTYEIFNIRTDNVAPDRDFYSRSSLLFDANQRNWLNYPVKMHGKTIIYGGVLTGDVHVDVYVKCESAMSEDDVITALKKHLEELRVSAARPVQQRLPIPPQGPPKPHDSPTAPDAGLGE